MERSPGGRGGYLQLPKGQPPFAVSLQIGALELGTHTSLLPVSTWKVNDCAGVPIVAFAAYKPICWKLVNAAWTVPVARFASCAFSTCRFFTIFKLNVPGAFSAEAKERREDANSKLDAIDNFMVASRSSSAN